MTKAMLIFEVMDKEPALLRVWANFLVIGIGGFLLGRYRHWLLFVVMPLALYVAWVHFSELHDPDVSPDILREAGRHYFTQSYVAMSLAITLPLVSLLTNRRQPKESAAP